ncbi:MAG TPA: hypothetical protein VEC19_00125 [Usitatibacter sp.]|nr:hypothetical protein [Usitatibacter sp.]
MSWLQRNPIAFALAAVAALLLVALAIEVGVGPGEDSAAPSKRGMAPEAKLLPPLAQATPEQAYSETTARPLFVPTRRPAPEVPTVAAPAFQRGQFTLQGVIVAGTNRTAMLREKSSGRVHRVETGKEVNGIKVVQIDPVAVTLGMGEEREVLPLTVQRPGAPAAGAPPAPVAQGGPFAPAPSPFPAATAAAPPPGMPQPAGPAFSRPGQPVARPNVVPPTPSVQAGQAPPPGTPQATTAPMSAEELLARRRARRAQQNQ